MGLLPPPPPPVPGRLPKPDPELSDPIGFEMSIMGNILWIVAFIVGATSLLISIWR